MATTKKRAPGTPTPSELGGQTEQTERLLTLIEEGHEVIKANTSAIAKLDCVIESLSKIQETMQNTLSLLVQQVTTSISQRAEAVPVRIVLIIVLMMAAIIAAVVGLNLAGLFAGVP